MADNEGYNYDFTSGIWKRNDYQGIPYSDGDEIEKRIFRAVSNENDVSLASFNLKKHIVDWPSRYHLSTTRANLLRPFEAIISGKVLEIGAGCGAITRYLGEVGGEIVAVEGSIRRAEIVAARCRDLKNVKIIADNIQKFHTDEKFDVVTLIGVLEYARVFLEEKAEDPVVLLLKIARSFLKPDGILLVAIENQLGLRYMAGNKEDHTDSSMFGINDLYSANSVVTFGRKELEQLMYSAGFRATTFYAPFPDYKLPSTIFTPTGLNSAALKYNLSSMLSECAGPNYMNVESEHFSLERAWKVLWRNDLVRDFANSFIVIASNNDIVVQSLHKDVVAFHYSSERKSEFMKESVFKLENSGLCVITRKIYPSQAIDAFYRQALVAHAAWIQGTLWIEELERIVNTPNWSITDVIKWTKFWLDAVKIENGKYNSNSIRKDTLVAGELLDAIPQNFIKTGINEGEFFDLEWHKNSPIELGYLLFRGLSNSFSRIRFMATPSDDTPIHLMTLILKVANKCGVNLTKIDIKRYAIEENDFQKFVSGFSDPKKFRHVERSKLSIRPILSSKLWKITQKWNVFKTRLLCNRNRIKVRFLRMQRNST